MLAQINPAALPALRIAGMFFSNRRLAVATVQRSSRETQP